jgi:hypothetical protein
MSNWVGSIHDPDVVFTDLALAMLGAYLAGRLWSQEGESRLRKAGALLMGALASAALWGAIFHAFFPEGTATLSGSLAWSPVVLSIVGAAAVMLDLSLRILLPRMAVGVHRVIVTVYAAGFAVVALLLDHSFTSIVYFYLPALLLLLLAAGERAIRSRSAGWSLIATGLLTSAGAAILQQMKLAVHPVYFDHNAVYHVVQSIAVLFLYFGWRRAAGAVPVTGVS